MLSAAGGNILSPSSLLNHVPCVSWVDFCMGGMTVGSCTHHDMSCTCTSKRHQTSTPARVLPMLYRRLLTLLPLTCRSIAICWRPCCACCGASLSMCSSKRCADVFKNKRRCGVLQGCPTYSVRMSWHVTVTLVCCWVLGILFWSVDKQIHIHWNQHMDRPGLSLSLNPMQSPGTCPAAVSLMLVSKAMQGRSSSPMAETLEL